jgi:hypothetical protein
MADDLDFSQVFSMFSIRQYVDAGVISRTTTVDAAYISRTTIVDAAYISRTTAVVTSYHIHS